MGRSTVDESDATAFQRSPLERTRPSRVEARRFLPQYRGAASPWIPAAAAPGLLPERPGAVASTHLGFQWNKPTWIMRNKNCAPSYALVSPECPSCTVAR